MTCTSSLLTFFSWPLTISDTGTQEPSSGPLAWALVAVARTNRIQATGRVSGLMACSPGDDPPGSEDGPRPTGVLPTLRQPASLVVHYKQKLFVSWLRRKGPCSSSS